MAMFRAIDLGDAKGVMTLLEEDPALLEVAMVSWHRETPLIHAAARGKLEIVKLLTGKGAQIHATTWLDGKTALHCAAERGHEKVVAYLLENGAQVGQQDGGHYTPLMHASEEGHIRVVLLLLTHMGEQAQRQALAATDASNRRTALHWAARGGHEEVVTALLGHGARADTRDKYGKSPLADAVHEGHLVVMLLLVDHLEMHALLQERDGNGKSLLHHAIEGRKEDSHHMVTYLLSQGLLPNLRDNHGSTALMYAAMGISRGNDMRSMQTLLEHMGGEGLDERNDAGRTALHSAVYHGRPANIRALLLAGADPTIVDNQGRPPRAVDAMRCRADCAAAFNWWDGELERYALLNRARALHDTYTTHQQAPTHPVPGYVEARVEAGLALPKVEVVAGPREVAGGERPPKRTSAALRAQAAAEKRQRKHAMLEWVVEELSAELFTELMQGFHAPHN